MELATEIIFKHRLFQSQDPEYNKEVMTNNYLSKEESHLHHEDYKKEDELGN